MAFPGAIALSHGHEFDYGTEQYHQLGTEAITEDGSHWRYCKVASGAALVAGDFIQAPVQDTAHQNLVSAAAAIGDLSVTMTLGASAVTANQYAEGYLLVHVTPGLGHKYRITSHPAADASAAVTVKLARYNPIRVALTTVSRLNLQMNPYKHVIQYPVTTATSVCVGVAPAPIALSNYGWLQTRGLACAQVDGTPAVGSNVVVPSSAAGACAIASSTLQVVGFIAVTGVDARCQAVLLNIN